jgi:cholesterol oxidase
MGNRTDESFDAVIVGSGFGGSVMAYRLAKAGLDVCLLERGKKWPPGSFPRTPLALKRAMWDPSDGLHGFFDVWSFKHIGALASSGLGGGSLIYANVLLRKDEHWFVDAGPNGCSPWPITYADLEPHYDAVEAVIQPTEYPDQYRKTTPKTVAFAEAAGAQGLNPFYPPLAVTFARPGEAPGEPIEEPHPNLHGVPRYTCRLVGECDAGCNFGSKNSLDFNYLSAAWRLGAELRCRHEVKAFEPVPGGGFRVEVVDHSTAEEGRKRTSMPERKVLFTRRLILSAGSLGSTYLLLANRSAFPKLSRRLGTRFSGNGDLVTFASRCTQIVDGKRVLREIEPSLGPVITMAARIKDTADGGDGPGFYIEDGGYPAFLAWVQEMLDVPRIAWTARRAVAKLAWKRLTGNAERNVGAELATLVGDRELAAGTLPLLGIGRELPQGTMRLRGGLLDIDWSFDVAKPYFDRVRGTMRGLAVAMGGEYKDDVLWRLNQVITVHPLGGCPMGGTAEEGVVDPHTGEVHNYPGLHVADGSVMPGPVGANPSLTIAALADRFADGILRLEGRL